MSRRYEERMRHTNVLIVTLVAAVIAFGLWQRAVSAERRADWAEAVAHYYRGEYYKSCMRAAERSGADMELSLYRCHDDEASIRMSGFLH